MRKLSLLIIAFLFHLFCFSQNWMNSAGGNSNDESFDVEVDNSGNIYTTGYVTTASTFGSIVNLTTNGFSDIYVSKSDANGNFIWAKVFGGTQADRGYDIALDNYGNIYVTGYFIGTATFGSTTITSTGNSQDVFVLKLDNLGNVVWVKSEGGGDGDTGYGITVDNNGNVVVTGQFKGNAQIGSNSFSSTIDPNTGLPAYDMFISKYDSIGNDLWSIQGTAKYDDRGLALKTDQNNNIYVTGQFSDTLSIAGSTYNNTIFNAGMLIKLDPSGNNLWFKRLGAIQTLVNDITIDNNGNVYITGDFLGQMIIISSNGNNFLNGNYTYRIFLIKFTSNGDIVWMQEDDSRSTISSKAITLDSNQDPYISGIFKCVFSEYADTLGQGLFNSVGFNDVFITKYEKTGARKWMKQYGGPLDDYCSGIAISQSNNPIISGGYSEYFNYPVGSYFTTFNGINQSFNYSWNANCFTPQYKYLNAVGSKDIFIGKPVDLTIPHYYYYESTPCYQSHLPCLEGYCPDSLSFCNNGNISVSTFTPKNGQHNKNYNSFPNYQHGPFFDFLWSNGDTLNSIFINTTGTYWVNTERIDGCSFKKDTVFVKVNPLPQLPHLTDDHNFNNHKYPNYNDIVLCYPDTAITSFGDLDTTYQFIYSTPMGTVYTDSLPHQIYLNGNYTVTVKDTNNCVNSADFELKYNYANNDSIIPKLLLLNDTICYGQKVEFIVYDSLQYPSPPQYSICTDIVSQVWNIGTGATTCLRRYYSPTSSGWYYVSVNFVIGYSNQCGINTTNYFIADSFYIVVNPLPSFSYNLSSDSPLCPGDTINVWTNNTHPSLNWTGPGIVNTTTDEDSIFVNQQGNYYYSGTITDSITGCFKQFYKNINVVVKPNPTIISNVPDNIICPGDSILLTCQQSGVNYEWVGPQGNVIGNTQSIWVDVPGFYHCILTDYDLCVLTSNTIELKEYNSPFILIDPGTVLCHSGSIELTAIFTGAPYVQWQPPSTSNDPSITVNLPGTYYVEITQCGFTIRDSVVITSANVDAEITFLSDSIICPGDTAILSANSGMAGYMWYPTNYTGQTQQATDTGSYYVIVTEPSTGCTAVSDTVHVSFHSGGFLPNIQNITICIGDTAFLENLNSGINTNWFADSNSIIPFITGNQIALTGILNDTIIYAENFDTNCTSSRIQVTISISKASYTPIILGNEIVCYNDSIILSTPTIPNGIYSWSGPNNYTSNQNPLIIYPIDTNNAGLYSLTISDGNCYSDDTSINISILPPPSVIINSPDTIWKCFSDTIMISATGDYQSILWSNGDSLDSTHVVIPEKYYAVGVGLNGCSIYSDTIYVFNYPISQPIFSDTTICYGDSILLSSSNHLLVSWYDEYFNFLILDSVYQTPALYNSVDYYTTTMDSNGCISPKSTISISVFPASGTPNIYGDTTLCEGMPLYFETDIFSGATYQWSNSSGILSTTPSLYIPVLSPLDSGYYYLSVTGNNCINAQGAVYVTISPPLIPPTIIGDSIYCTSDTLILYTDSSYYSLVWSDSQFNTYYQDTLILNYLDTYNAGEYYVWSEDSSGCLSNADTINITILDAPSTPMIYSSNNYCIGDTIILNTDSLVTNNILWNGPNGYSSTNDSNIILNANTIHSGLYSLTITDSNGCKSTSSANINIINYPSINLGNDTTFCYDSLTNYIVQVDSTYDYYMWQDGSTDYFFNITEAGSYYVTVFTGNCSSTDSIIVQVDSCLINNIPNVVTPNGDGINDFFIIKNIERYPYSTLEIYNRWGKVVFKDDNYSNNFNGIGLSVGTYYYVFIPNDPLKVIDVQKGFISIIK